jgi:hypothetical protein
MFKERNMGRKRYQAEQRLRIMMHMIVDRLRNNMAVSP